MRSASADAGEGGAVSAEDAAESRLAHLTARLANASSAAELPDIEQAIAAELGADDVCLLRIVEGGEHLESVSQRRWMGFGQRLRASYYATIRNVLSTGDAVHVLDGDPAADGAELSLLRRADAGAMLLAPIVAGGRDLGVLMLFCGGDRRFSRAEVSRARVIGYALAPLMGSLVAPPASPSLTVVPDAAL
jgi:GAF domain-containing protein